MKCVKLAVSKNRTEMRGKQNTKIHCVGRTQNVSSTLMLQCFFLL